MVLSTSLSKQLGQGGLGLRRRTGATPPSLRGCRGGLLGAGSDRLKRDRVAPHREPRPASGPAPSARGSRCRRTVGRRPRAARRSRRPRASVVARTGIRRPPRLTEPAPWPCRTAVRWGSWRPFCPHTAVTSASMIAAITCSPVPTARASGPRASHRPARRAPRSPVGHGGLARVDLLVLVGLAHGGPLPRGVLGGSPEYLPRGGLRRGTAGSSSTRSGTTSGPGRCRQPRRQVQRQARIKTWSQNHVCRYVIFGRGSLIVVGRGKNDAAAAGRGSALGADRTVDTASPSTARPGRTTADR